MLSLEEISSKIDALAMGVKSILNCSPIRDTWIDTEDVCSSLNISKRTLQKHVKAGIFKSSTIGRRVYFKAPEILSYLEENHKHHRDYARSND